MTNVPEVNELESTARLARWSVALGTFGLLTAVFGIGVLLALVAIALALVALNQISEATAQELQGLAIVGLLAGILALLVFPLLVATAVPRFFSMRQHAAHVECYENLIAIDSVKTAWADARNAREGARIHAAALFGNEGVAPAKPVCPAGGSYRVNPLGTPARCSNPLHNEPPGRVGPPRQLKLS
jgi:hypothetical protein